MESDVQSVAGSVTTEEEIKEEVEALPQISLVDLVKKEDRLTPKEV